MKKHLQPRYTKVNLGSIEDAFNILHACVDMGIDCKKAGDSVIEVNLSSLQDFSNVIKNYTEQKQMLQKQQKTIEKPEMSFRDQIYKCAPYLKNGNATIGVLS